MRTYFYCALLSALVIGTNFFCSNLPFDSYTNLGSDVLNDQDSLLTVFDGKIYKGFLDVTSAEHFLDTTDSMRSGLNRVTPIPIGAWRNERSFAYFKFNAKALKDSLALITRNRNNTFLSFSVTFTNDADKSDPADNACLEFGYYFDSTMPDSIITKSDTALIDTSKFKEIGHFTYNGNVSATYTIPLNKNYFVKDTMVSDTSTILYRYEKIDTVEWGMVPESTIVDTINSLISFQKDTVVFNLIIKSDTVIVNNGPDTNITFDTSYVIGFVNFFYKNINPPEQLGDIVKKETIVYDTIASATSLLKENQTLLYSATVESLHINGDDTITFLWDTLITLPETTTVYEINTKTIHVINGTDTTEITQYDTVHILTTIIQDSIFQAATVSKKNSFIYNATNALWDSLGDTTLSLYARLDSVQSNSLQFLKDFHLKLTYIKNSNNATDTISAVFPPYYSDFTVMEVDSAGFGNALLSSGGSGRYTRLALDMSALRDSALGDDDSAIIYHNVPRAVVTLYLDSIRQHVSTGGVMFARYILSPVKTDNVEDIIYKMSGDEKVPLYKFSGSIADTTTNLEIKINSFLIDIMKAKGTMPKTVFLYLWLSPGYFEKIYWRKMNTLPMDFIVSDSQ